jgi:hypothetical protein
MRLGEAYWFGPMNQASAAFKIPIWNSKSDPDFQTANPRSSSLMKTSVSLFVPNLFGLATMSAD